MELRADQRFVGACAFLAASLLICASAPAQQGGSDAKRALTATDYAQAEKFMPYNTTPLVYGADRVTWLSGDRFWYKSTTAEGSQFVVVNAATGERKPAFDHAALAAALSQATGMHYDARHLPSRTFDFSEDERTISFAIRGKRWECNLQSYECSAKETLGEMGPMQQVESLSARMAAEAQ